MVFSLIRVFRFSGYENEFKELTTFLETVLDREPPLLHVFDGFCDQYWRRRIDGHAHGTVMVKLSDLKMLELREDNDTDWVIVTLPLKINITHTFKASIAQNLLRQSYYSPGREQIEDHVEMEDFSIKDRDTGDGDGDEESESDGCHTYQLGVPRQ